MSETAVPIPISDWVITKMDGKPYPGDPHTNIQLFNTPGQFKEAEHRGLENYQAKEQKTGSGIVELWGHRPTQEDRVIVAGFDKLDELLTTLPPTLHEKYINEILQETIAEIQTTLPADLAEIAGSTVAANIIYKNKIYNLSLGDSDTFVAIYDAAGKVTVTRLNVLHHDADDPLEAKRIMKEKGPKAIYHGRISGELAVSRAIGDRQYEANGLSHHPDLYQQEIKIPTAGKAIVITACDGMTEQWKNKSKAAIEKLLALELKGTLSSDPSEIAVKLATMAIDKHSNDNISVVVTPIDLLGKTKLANVFDGHGSDDVSEYIYQRFPIVLANRVADKILALA